jgi:hypothetical protein
VRPAATAVGAFGLALVLAALTACTEDAERRPIAPPSLRGTVVMEPPRIGIGETAFVEVAVVAPPGHRVAPVPTPESLEGFSILGAEARSVERHANRWIHRTRFQIRAHETGSFAWPAERLEVEAPDGTRSTVEIAERPLVVEEVSKEFPGRQTFFPVRTPRLQRRSQGVLLPAAVGALFALAGVGLVVLVRRVRSGRADATGESAVEDATPWQLARAALADASEIASGDPCRASDMASGALRLYVSRRSRIPATTQTTQELEETEPPYALAARWPDLLGLLRALDEVRFLPPDGAADARAPARVAAVIREAQALMTDLGSRDSWR